MMDMVQMTKADADALDAVVHALGIEDSHITPVEAVRMLQGQNEALQKALRDILKTTPDERRDPAVWFARVDAARAALVLTSAEQEAAK